MKLLDAIDTLTELKHKINAVSPVQIGFVCARNKGFSIYKINPDQTIGANLMEGNNAVDLVNMMSGMWKGLEFCIVE